MKSFIEGFKYSVALAIAIPVVALLIIVAWVDEAEYKLREILGR